MGENYVPTFEGALAALKAGRSVARNGWNGKGMFLTLQILDENSKMKRPYIYITIYITPDADYVIPWVASQADLLADDWEVLPA